MAIERLKVFLPCHTLDDFPTWLDDAQADDLLAAWTAAWEPCLLAAVGDVPGWASIDLFPPEAAPLLGIVPSAFSDRFVGAGAGADPASRFVERVSGRAAIAAAAARQLGVVTLEPPEPPEPSLPGSRWSDDFAALGLAVLISDMLARRMRSTLALATTSFAAAAVAAARAAVAGDDAAVEAGLGECRGCLEGCRARYYPVDVWMLDLVLLSEGSRDLALAKSLAAAPPSGLVANGLTFAAIAAADPAAAARIRHHVADGSAEPLGGRIDDRAVDLCTPEELLESFRAGMALTQEVTGAAPRVFARYAGGASDLMPDLLSGLGFIGLVWPQFDGTSLPDPRASRLRWESAGAATEGVARPPLDARRPTTVLGLAEQLADTMDHDHVAVLSFAHFAGTASPWYRLLRRFGARSTALGSFLRPSEFFERTGGAGTHVRFEADAFPPTPPPDVASALTGIEAAATDPIGAEVERAADAARRILHGQAAVAEVLVAPTGPTTRAEGTDPPPRIELPGTSGKAGWWSVGWWPWSGGHRHPALDNNAVRLEIHPDTGGIVTLARRSDRGNRLSQRLAVRDDRAGGYTSMQADSIERGMVAAGAEGIVSRGRLLAADGRVVGRFTQGLSLVPGLPLAVLDLDVELAEGLGPHRAALESYLACRFAWNENEDFDLHRSLHTRAVPTAREVFTAPHFVELRPAGRRAAADTLTILTGGMPWHVLSSPHVLDTLLAAGGGGSSPDPVRVVRRIAVGLGLGRPSEAGLALAATGCPLVRQPPTPPGVRLTGGELERDAGRPARVRVGLLETAGRSDDVRLEWAGRVISARACNPPGGPEAAAGRTAHVAIDGRSTIVLLRAGEWLHLELELQLESDA
jgi:hypothetical protein